VNEHLHYQRLVPLDDAAGELLTRLPACWDWNILVPVDPERLVRGIRFNIIFRAWLEDSGIFLQRIKTAVMREVRQMDTTATPSSCRLAASQAAVVDVLVTKPSKQPGVFSQNILVAGGVSANRLRHSMQCSHCPLHIPHLVVHRQCHDCRRRLLPLCPGQRDWLDRDVLPNWPLSKYLRLPRPRAAIS
jgi:tRNA A37 threonylcarbamoyltransferase TsaD